MTTARMSVESTMDRSNLSPRQQETMLCLPPGSSNQKIADELGPKPSAVRNIIAAVSEMLRLSNRVQRLLWIFSFESLAEEMLAAC